MLPKDEWTDEWMNEWADEWINKWMNKCMLPMNVTLVSKLLESFKPHSALQSSGIIGANNT